MHGRKAHHATFDIAPLNKPFARQEIETPFTTPQPRHRNRMYVQSSYFGFIIA
jgi:hypothetical protein